MLFQKYSILFPYLVFDILKLKFGKEDDLLLKCYFMLNYCELFAFAIFIDIEKILSLG